MKFLHILGSILTWIVSILRRTRSHCTLVDKDSHSDENNE